MKSTMSTDNKQRWMDIAEFRKRNAQRYYEGSRREAYKFWIQHPPREHESDADAAYREYMEARADHPDQDPCEVCGHFNSPTQEGDSP